MLSGVSEISKPSKQNDNEIKVYHITASEKNPITWRDIKKISEPLGEKYPVSFKV